LLLNIAIDVNASIEIANPLLPPTNVNHQTERLGMSTAAHGSNLVADTEHWSRVQSIQTDLISTIELHLGALYKVITFIKSGRNIQSIQDLKFNINIEDNIDQTDQFQKYTTLDRPNNDETLSLNQLNNITNSSLEQLQKLGKIKRKIVRGKILYVEN